MQAQMVMGQAIEQAGRQDLEIRLTRQCWFVCYDTHLRTDELVTATIEESKAKAASKCTTKCIARHFEVLGLMIDARQQHAKEAALGLPHGALDAH